MGGAGDTAGLGVEGGTPLSERRLSGRGWIPRESMGLGGGWMPAV